jgi:predicted AAA+ superfamily ATPase
MMVYRKQAYQAVSQGARGFGKRSMLRACEHLQNVLQRRITAPIPGHQKPAYQAVSQGARGFGKRSMLRACEHLQDPAQRRITA